MIEDPSSVRAAPLPEQDRTLPLLFALTLLWVVAAPYPGFVGSVALRAVDLSTLWALGGLVVGAAFSSRLRVNGRVMTAHALVAALLTWQTATLLLALFRAREGFSTLAPLYRPIVYDTALWAGAAAGSRMREQDVTAVATIALVANALVATAQFITGPGLAYYLFSGRSTEAIGQHYGSRVIGTLGNPNYLGVMMAALAGFFAFRFVTGRGWRNVVGVMVAALLVLLSQSRTSLAVLFGVGLVSLALSLKAPRDGGRFVVVLRWLLLLAPAILGLLALLSALHIELRYLWTGIQVVLKEGLTQQSSFAGRVAVWQQAWERILENPLVGWGPSTGYADITFVDNNYIALVFRYGLIGFFLTIGTVAYLVITAGIAAVRGSVSGALAVLLWTAILLGSMTMDVLESMRLTPLAFALSGAVLAAGASANT